MNQKLYFYRLARSYVWYHSKNVRRQENHLRTRTSSHLRLASYKIKHGIHGLPWFSLSDNASHTQTSTVGESSEIVQECSSKHVFKQAHFKAPCDWKTEHFLQIHDMWTGPAANCDVCIWDISVYSTTNKQGSLSMLFVHILSPIYQVSFS